jgi:hypothetical protein
MDGRNNNKPGHEQRYPHPHHHQQQQQQQQQQQPSSLQKKMNNQISSCRKIHQQQKQQKQYIATATASKVRRKNEVNTSTTTNQRHQTQQNDISHQRSHPNKNSKDDITREIKHKLKLLSLTESYSKQNVHKKDSTCLRSSNGELLPRYGNIMKMAHNNVQTKIRSSNQNLLLGVDHDKLKYINDRLPLCKRIDLLANIAQKYVKSAIEKPLEKDYQNVLATLCKKEGWDTQLEVKRDNCIADIITYPIGYHHTTSKLLIETKRVPRLYQKEFDQVNTYNSTFGNDYAFVLTNFGVEPPELYLRLYDGLYVPIHGDHDNNAVGNDAAKANIDLTLQNYVHNIEPQVYFHMGKAVPVSKPKFQPASTKKSLQAVSPPQKASGTPNTLKKQQVSKDSLSQTKKSPNQYNLSQQQKAPKNPHKPQTLISPRSSNNNRPIGESRRLNFLYPRSIGKK